MTVNMEGGTISNMEEINEQLKEQLDMSEKLLFVCMRTIASVHDGCIDKNMLCEQLQKALEGHPVGGELLVKIVDNLNIPTERLASWISTVHNMERETNDGTTGTGTNYEADNSGPNQADSHHH